MNEYRKANVDNYRLAYSEASKLMNNADEKLQKIIDKLTDDEWETLRDRFADFYVMVTELTKNKANNINI